MSKFITPTSYRQNVAIVVLNEFGEILTCERSDTPGAWQLPQGGIEPGESAEDAMWRELNEEIGTTEVELLGALSKTIKYEWPANLFGRGYRGQEQYYFLVRLKQHAKLSIVGPGTSGEFGAWEWQTAANFFSRLKGFKAEAYKSGILSLAARFPGTVKER